MMEKPVRADIKYWRDQGEYTSYGERHVFDQHKFDEDMRKYEAQHEPVFIILGIGNIPDTDQNTVCYTKDGIRQPSVTLRDLLLAYHKKHRLFTCGSGLTWEEQYPKSYTYQKDDKLEKLLRTIDEANKKCQT